MLTIFTPPPTPPFCSLLLLFILKGAVFPFFFFSLSFYLTLPSPVCPQASPAAPLWGGDGDDGQFGAQGGSSTHSCMFPSHSSCQPPCLPMSHNKWGWGGGQQFGGLWRGWEMGEQSYLVMRRRFGGGYCQTCLSKLLIYLGNGV